jgi:hypothetical protein
MTRASYRFFDTGFTLETDSAAFAAEFARVYGDFKSGEEIAHPVYGVSLSASPSVTIDGETWRSANPDALGLYAYNAILNTIAARVRSHFLFHAAALTAPPGPLARPGQAERAGTGGAGGAADGGGVILAGGSGLGKTTLTLALSERGYPIFSDDMAAVGRADGRLYPFPRSLGLRVPGAPPGGKLWLDADGSRAAASCPARYLFVLADPTGAPDPASATWYLLLERIDDSLLAELRAVDGLRGLQELRGGAFPALRVALAPDAWPAVEPEIQAACRRCDILLFEVTHGPETAPDFRATPELLPLSPTEAARELLGHLKGGPRSALLREAFDGSAARLYLALSDLAAGMACYRLRVGRLPEMVEAIVGATR